jgi:hypothetical protein
MSDDGIPELDLPPPPPPPRPSAPGGVRSAMRAAPLPEEKRKLTKEVLREGAVETVLNSVGILRDVIEDFRSSDRFFKYKAGVLAMWLFLSLTSVGVSCSGGAPTGNSFGARLVVAGDSNIDRAYMLKNDSDNEWQAVTVTINGRYFVTAAQLRPYGDITLTPRLMYDESGTAAPQDIVIRDIQITCSDGEAFLLKGGAPQ